ncbi:MAG: YceI family protein [Frankiaceae bacterium]|nr:YceI family protein [Frankiaceae bacterium]
MTTATISTTTTGLDVQTLTGDYTLDTAHSRLGFVARHAMVTKVRGSFEEFEGTAHLDFQDPTRSSAGLTIQVASITTNQKQRDEHLRTSDFFDAPTYGQITFTSTKAEVVGDDTYRLTGDLTIKDVTKPVSIDFAFTGAAKDPYGNIRVGFDGSTVIKRSDWGISWNAALETGGVMVSDKITLEFDISAIKTA